MHSDKDRLSESTTHPPYSQCPSSQYIDFPHVDIIELKNKMITSKAKFKQQLDVSEIIRKQALKLYDWEINSKNLVDEINKVECTRVNGEIINSCIQFNEKKFPKIYKFKSFYKFAFWFYKVIKK